LKKCLPDGHNASVNPIFFFPDGQHIVSRSNDKPLYMWNVRTGALIDGLLKAHIPLTPVTCISFSPSGLRVATAFEKMVQVYNVHVQPTVADLLKNHINMVFSVGFRVFSDTEPMVSVGVEHTVAPAFHRIMQFIPTPMMIGVSLELPWLRYQMYLSSEGTGALLGPSPSHQMGIRLSLGQLTQQYVYGMRIREPLLLH
jgi:hypothetical protein